MMNPPKPGDNLHKFMGLGGLFLALCFFILPALFFYRTSIEYLAQLRTSDKLQVHEKFTKERLTTLDNRKHQTINEKNKLEARLDKLNAASKASGNSIEIDKLQSRLDEVNLEIKSIEDTSYQMSFDLALRQIDAKNDEQLSINQRRNSRVVLVLGVIMGIGFSVTSFKGFKQWRRRLKGFHTEEVEVGAQIQAKTEADKLEQVKLEQPKLDPGKLEQVKLEQLKLDPGKLEQVKLGQPKLDPDELKQVKLEQPKLDTDELKQAELEHAETSADKT
jgi:hypothetical protein